MPELDLYYGCVRRKLGDGRQAYIEGTTDGKGRICVGKMADMGYDHGY